MADDCLQEAVIAREEAIEKLIELSAKNSDDFESYKNYFNYAIKGDTEYSYLAWLKDDRFSMHVKLAIYEQQFTPCLFYIAQKRLDQVQVDQDMYDYLCHHLTEKTYFPYRDMLASFLDLIGKLLRFDYPTKTCQKIVDIALNPKNYNKHQVCCALDALRYCHYRFKVTWEDGDRFYKDMAETWSKIVLETDDLDICTEGLYYVLKKGNLESAEYQALVEKLWDKHPHDRVTVALYGQYLKPCVMLLAFHRLKLLREHDASLAEKVVGMFSNKVSSPEFMQSVDFDPNNELIQFCISNKECQKDFIEGINQQCNTESYFKMSDILLSFYLRLDRGCKLKTTTLDILVRTVRSRDHLGVNECFYAYLDMVNTYIEKIANTFVTESKDAIKQLRCVQALALLFRFSSVHDRIKKKLKYSILLMLTKHEKNSGANTAVRQILLYIYLAMLRTSINYQDIQEVVEKVRDAPELYESYLLILYHALTYLKSSEDELNSLFSVVVQHKKDCSTRILALTQVLYDKATEFCQKNRFENVELLQNEHEPAINESELGSDRVFLKGLNPFSDFSLEIVFCLIPKLNEIDTDEWKNNIEICNYYRFVEPKNKSVIDNLKILVDEFLSKD